MLYNNSRRRLLLNETERQGMRVAGYGLSRKPIVRARNSARASCRCSCNRCGTVNGCQAPPRSIWSGMVGK